MIPVIMAIGPFASPESLVKKGNRFFAEKKYDEALPLYDRAEELANDKAPIHYNRGNAFFRRNDIPAAVKEYQKGASLADGKLRAMSLYNMGNAWFTEGKFSDAAKAYKEALKHDPTDRDAKINLEITLKRMEEEEIIVFLSILTRKKCLNL